VVYAPAHGEGVVGVVGAGAVRFRTNPDRDDVVQVRAIPAQGLTVLASTSQPSPTSQAIIDRVKLNRFQQRHSSIKYLDIACGRADLMVAARDVYFWDSAAGDAALRAAGGMTLGLDGQPLRYNRDQPGLLHHGLVACGDTAYTVAVLAG
jgi:3'(2'), 5'-bisphosphate nucleotidase